MCLVRSRGVTVRRFWFLPTRVFTSTELRQLGISRLRAIDLGRCETEAEAHARAANHASRQPADILARNVRLACDAGDGARWGLSAEQISRLRAGEMIEMEDRLGRFAIAYTRRRQP